MFYVLCFQCKENQEDCVEVFCIRTRLLYQNTSVVLERFMFYLFNVRKTKKIAKFVVLEPRGCKDINGTDAPNRNRPS